MAEVIYGFIGNTASLVAGANVTLSQSAGTITIQAAVNPGATTFLAGMSTDGNTAGTSGAVNNQLEIVGGTNITLSQSKNLQSATLSIVGAVISNTLGISNVGNTSGTSGVVTGQNIRYVLAGGNNITLSQSINGSSGTVTISAFTQTVQTQNLHNLTISGNTSGVLAAISSGTLTLVGGNNVTLSQAGNAVTISGPQTFGPATSISSISNNNSSGTQTASYALADHVHAGVYQAGVSTFGNTAGSTRVSPGRIVLVGGNNITLSMSTDAASGMTISIIGV